MEKRYQVFVSSTYDDLKEERGKVITALLNIDCIPCGMEYFPAADEDAWQCIERLIPECDYYVIILAGRYGSIPKNSTKSYIHQEYELARKHGIPIISLLHIDPLKLPAEKCEQESKLRKKLDKFRQEVARKLCKFWMTGDQLAAELLSSLTKQIKDRPRPGWVRSSALATDAAKDEIISLRRKIESQEKIIQIHQKRETKENPQLASGDDLAIITFLITTINEAETLRKQEKYDMISTWNALLRFIGSWDSSHWHNFTLDSRLKSAIEHAWENSQNDFKNISSIIIDQDEIDKIPIQLSALGIISKNSYGWSFTAKGNLSTTKLRALRKGETHLPTQDSWFVLRGVGESKIDEYSKKDVEEWGSFKGWPI